MVSNSLSQKSLHADFFPEPVNKNPVTIGIVEEPAIPAVGRRAVRQRFGDRMNRASQFATAEVAIRKDGGRGAVPDKVQGLSRQQQGGFEQGPKRNPAPAARIRQVNGCLRRGFNSGDAGWNCWPSRSA